MSTLFNMLARILADRHSKQQFCLALYCSHSASTGSSLSTTNTRQQKPREESNETFETHDPRRMV